MHGDQTLRAVDRALVGAREERARRRPSPRCSTRRRCWARTGGPSSASLLVSSPEPSNVRSRADPSPWARSAQSGFTARVARRTDRVTGSISQPSSRPRATMVRAVPGPARQRQGRVGHLDLQHRAVPRVEHDDPTRLRDHHPVPVVRDGPWPEHRLPALRLADPHAGHLDLERRVRREEHRAEPSSFGDDAGKRREAAPPHPPRARALHGSRSPPGRGDEGSRGARHRGSAAAAPRRAGRAPGRR